MQFGTVDAIWTTDPHLGREAPTPDAICLHQHQRTELVWISLPSVQFGIPNTGLWQAAGLCPSAVNGNSNPGYQRPFYARLA